MMYPFLTLDDQTEIVHSEMREDGTVKVYRWSDVFGFTENEMNRLHDVIESTAHLILKYSKASFC